MVKISACLVSASVALVLAITAFGQAVSSAPVSASALLKQRTPGNGRVRNQATQRAASPVEMLRQFDGNAFLRAYGDIFIGVVSSDRNAENSICNPYSEFGNQRSLFSIRNRSSHLGSSYTDTSAYNSSAQNPPAIIFEGKQVAYLTKNTRLQNALDPDILFDALCPRDFQ